MCLDYEVFGFVLSNLHVRNVPVKLACILPYELIAFPDLDGCQFGDLSGADMAAHLCLGIRPEEDGSDRLHFEEACIRKDSAPQQRSGAKSLCRR